MQLGLGGIVTAHVVVTLMLLGLGLYARWPVKVKVGAVGLVTAAWLGVYFALPHLLGWPTDQNVPRRFNLLGVYIQEPDPSSGEGGTVFFWAGDLAPGADPRPRAYRMPFKASFKSVFQEAHGKLRQNIPQEGEIELDDDAQGKPLDWTRLGQKSVKIKFRDAPANLPPTKGGP